MVRPRRPRPQTIPQAFMAGLEFTESTIHDYASADLCEPALQVLVRVYDAVVHEEFDHTGVWEGDHELTFDELKAEGLLE